MITRIELNNIKGVSKILENIKPVVVFHGENGAGKTAWIDAIQCALVGHHIALGAKPTEMVRLCSALPAGAVITVGKTDYGFEFSEKGKLTRNEPVGVSQIMLDLSAFTGMTSRERVGYLLEISGTDSKQPTIDWPEYDSLIEIVGQVKFTGSASKWLTDLGDQLSRAVRDANAEVKAIGSQVSALRSSFDATPQYDPDAYNEALVHLEKVSQVIGSMDASLVKCQMASTIKAKLELLGDVAELKRDKEKAHNSIVDNDKTISQLDALIAEEQSKIDSNKSLIVKCPTCGRTPDGSNVDLVAIEKTIASREAVLSAFVESKVEWAKKRDAAIVKLERCKADIKTHKDLTENLKKLEVGEPMAVTVEKVADLKKQREVIKAQIADLDDKRAKFESFERDRLKRNELNKRMVEATNLATHASAAVKLVKAASEELVAKSIDPVIARANKLMAGIFPLIEFRDGEFGIVRHGQFVSKTLSGAEQLCVFASLQVALCSDTTPGCRILMVDELSRLSPNRKIAFLRRMNELVKEGVIDQFLGCDVVQPGIATNWLQSVIV